MGGPARKYFSAICWMFGRRLHDRYQVPIGHISNNYGGTSVEAWSSPAYLNNVVLQRSNILVSFFHIYLIFNVLKLLIRFMHMYVCRCMLMYAYVCLCMLMYVNVC